MQVPTPPRSRSSRLTLLAASGVALVALAGCSGSVNVSSGGGYDADKLSQQIVDAQQKVTPDLEVTDGSCPADEDLEEGATFECTISIAGVTAPYTTTVTSVEGDSANFSFDPAQAIISTAGAVGLLTSQLTEQGITDGTADCGEAAVIVQDPQTTFPCTISYSDGSVQDFELTINDIDGNVTVTDASK